MATLTPLPIASDCDGNWSASISNTLAEGSHAIEITQADSFGNTATVNDILKKDITPSAPTLGTLAAIDATIKTPIKCRGLVPKTER